MLEKRDRARAAPETSGPLPPPAPLLGLTLSKRPPLTTHNASSVRGNMGGRSGPASMSVMAPGAATPPPVSATFSGMSFPGHGADSLTAGSLAPYEGEARLAHRGDHSSTTTVRLSLLLNPSDEDDEPEPDGSESDLTRRLRTTPETAKTTNATVVAKVPKKRGRKAFLPKMSNSERGKYYRAKRLAYSSELNQEVENLRSMIARLEILRGISNELAVCPRSLTSGSLVKLVREYFVQFRYGVQLPPARRNMAVPDVETSTKSQEVFMRATMDPDVSFGEFKGIGVVMDQWQRYSKYHAFLQFELLEVHVRENEDGYIVETNGQLRSRYSRRTIENVFPHVIGNEALIQRLIGKEVVYPCRNQFYFTADGRVQRYDVEADFPEALQKALGNLEDVAILLGQALIRQQHMMGELEGEELAVIEEIERRTDSHGIPPHRGTHNDTSLQSRAMDVDFLLSDDNDSMDMSD